MSWRTERELKAYHYAKFVGFCLFVYFVLVSCRSCKMINVKSTSYYFCPVGFSHVKIEGDVSWLHVALFTYSWVELICSHLKEIMSNGLIWYLVLDVLQKFMSRFYIKCKISLLKPGRALQLLWIVSIFNLCFVILAGQYRGFWTETNDSCCVKGTAQEKER